MTGPRFVDVPADRLLDQLRIIGDAVVGRGGSFQHRVMGSEVVFDITPPRAMATVRVYTSLAEGASRVRDVGADAVRVVVLAADGSRALGKSEKILRTAPAKSADRVGVFLERLTARIRVKYGEARAIPGCDACGKIMAMRTRKSDGSRFWGCTGYPECTATRRTE